MAYKIVSQAKAWWPIRFNGVNEDGSIVVNEIKGRFRILDEDEHVQLELETSKVTVSQDDPDVKLSALTAPFVMRILEDWQDVTEDDGTESGASVTFNQENVLRMLKVPNFATGVAEAYRAVRAAQPDTRKGN